jgi:hypothetical protein
MKQKERLSSTAGLDILGTRLSKRHPLKAISYELLSMNLLFDE